MSETATANVEEQAPQVEVQAADLPEARDKVVRNGTGQIDLLLETPMPVTVQLGQCELLIRDLLQLGPGSVVRLDKRAGEPVDLYLRGHVFARGQLVVVGEQLGVRITEILPGEDKNAP